MKKLLLISISFVLINLFAINAQLINDWQKIWSNKIISNTNDSIVIGANLIKAVDSLHIGFVFGMYNLGPTGIILTTNGGNNWDVSYLSSPLDTHRLSIRDWAYINKKVIYFLADTAVQIGYNGLEPVINYKAYIFKSTDGGHNWQKIPINDKWRSRQSVVLSMTDSLNGIMLQFPSEYESSETTDRILYTNDGWKTWEKIKTHPNMLASYNAFYEYPKTIVTKTYGYEKIFITYDLGESWTEKLIPDSLRAYDINRDDFIFYKKDIYFLVRNKQSDEYHSVIYKTTNSGDDWEIIYESRGMNNSVLDISVINDSTFYLHGRSPLYTSNNGKDWIKTNNAYFDNYKIYIRNIIEFSKNNKIAYGIGSIFKYSGGKTLQPPTFTAPDSSHHLPLNFHLGWTPIVGASGYHLQIVERIGNPFDSLRPPPDFGNSILFVNDSLLTDTTYQLTGTSDYKEYSCRIRAFNDSLSSPWLSKVFWTAKATDIKDNFNSKKSLFLFPNPIKNNETIYINFNVANNSNIIISLINNLGIEVSDIYKGYIEHGSHTIGYSTDVNLPSGTYWIRMTINNKKTIVKPVVLLK